MVDAQTCHVQVGVVSQTLFYELSQLGIQKTLRHEAASKEYSSDALFSEETESWLCAEAFDTFEQPQLKATLNNMYLMLLLFFIVLVLFIN